MSKKPDFRNLKPVGKCKVCEINCWAETGNEPAIWPCGLANCPYPHKPQKPFLQSATGSSLALIMYDGS